MTSQFEYNMYNQLVIIIVIYNYYTELWFLKRYFGTVEQLCRNVGTRVDMFTH